MRGEGAPNPIYEGEDGVIAWMLGGPDAEYAVPLPAPGERPRAILETYPKAHSAEYQAQALIDLAFDLRRRLPPGTSRAFGRSSSTRATTRTRSSAPARTTPRSTTRTPRGRPWTTPSCTSWRSRSRTAAGTTSTPTGPSAPTAPSTIALWRKIRTVEDPAWTARYHDPDPGRKAFGGRVDIELDDGVVISAERLVADAHPNGRRPWRWPDYAEKLAQLTDGRLPQDARERVPGPRGAARPAGAREVRRLNPALAAGSVMPDRPADAGIF